MKSKSMKNLVVISVVLIAIISLTFAFGITAGISGRMRSVYAAWTGEGTGTSDDPYLIGAKADLLTFRDIVNGSNGEAQNRNACAKLTANIDLEGDADNQWTPIGLSSAGSYSGAFDGNGYTISGLYINDTTMDYAGLFGYSGSGSTIKDLTVAGTIICNNGAGIVRENNGNILRCVNKADVDAQQETGGIAVSSNGNITECVNAGTVYARTKGVNFANGGIAARNMGEIIGCVNNGVVKAFSTKGRNSYTGGIVGINRKIVSYCVNNGRVIGYFGSGEWGSSANHFAGITAYQYNNSETVVTTRYCVNNGEVNYEGDDAVFFSAGIIGNTLSRTTVENCYNAGIVKTSVVYPSAATGITLFNNDDTENCVVRNCYNIGEIMKGNNAGEPITNITGLAENCYYLADQTGEANANIRALSEADFADASNFSNWDFSDVWTMYQEKIGFMRPYLVKTRVNYYSKDNAATGYSQPSTLWGVDDVLSELHEPADFGDDYEGLFDVIGATHDGWTTEIGGEKVYDFGGTYTGKDALTLYPHYTINAPTSVATEGYVAEYDGASHNISITVTHELAGATITYQWYLREALNPAFALITGATGSTYSVKNGGDSGLYKVTYRVSLPGHGEYKAYEAEENAIYVNITAGEDPTTFPEQMTATIGQTLADVDLPDGWAWIDTTTALNTIGSFWFEAKYNNDDAFVYQANVIVNHGAWTGIGTGTAADPYIIENKEQLEFFRDIVNGKFGATKNNKACAKLGANINLAGSNNDQWSPFVLYTGVFDGNGYTIKGVYINKPSSDIAFFMEIALGGIKNLTLEGYVACFDGGGFVETVREGVVISNCHNKVTVIGDKTNNPYNLAVGARTGGIAAYNYGTIEDCTNNADVQSFRPGGIVGENYGTIRRCENNYSLTVVSYNGGGGIAGAMQGAAVIEYCINRGDLFDPTKTFSCLGGICGTAKESGENFPIIRYCVNEGKISGQTSNGGILGIAKHNYIVIRDCYNLADIVGTSYCAGICGVGGAVYNSYNMGSYPGTTQGHHFGPICGDSTRIYNCYYLDDQTGEMTNGQKALSLADFADAANFVDWDFEKVWTIKDGRPQLYRDFVRYYDKNGDEVTACAQPRTILGVDDVVLPGVTICETASITDYSDLYGANSVTHVGWSTVRGGEKVYDFGEAYSGAETRLLYPVYTGLVAPTITVEGYTGTYDSAAHDLTATVEHDLGDDATYTYQWYKLDGSEYEAIDGATGSAYSVTEIADSGTYKVVATLHFAGYTVDGQKTDIVVTISKIDPTYDVPADLTATINDTLGSVALPDGWTWNEPEKVLNKVGPEVCAATFTPEDTDHYNVVEIDLTVGVYHAAWDGEGTGTEADPYVITTKAELEHFRDIVNGYYVETKNEYASAVLANDIDLNGSDSDQWSPIGDEEIDSSNAFSGNFDGAGHTISGLYINTDNDDYTYKGLFGDAYRATIKNLTVDGSVTCNRGGGIVGSLSGMIINCVSNVNVTARDFGGGLVCYTVIAAGQAGLTWRYPQIINCVNNGNVSGFYRAGGMTSYNAGHIIGCVNNGNILIDRNQDETYTSGYAGGIAGENAEYIAYCVNNGTVTVSIINPLHSNDVWGRAGGIAAMNWSEKNRDKQKIQYCINNGEVKCDCTNLARNSAGGIVAYDNCVVENCYNTAKVTGLSTVGGICGKSSDDAEDAGWITNCYNLGIVVKANNAAGAQIMDIGNAIVTGCHYLADTTDDATGALAQADFADSAKFVGWDFDKVWTMYQEENDFSRPHLFGGDVRYYDKNYWSTAYAQPKTILDVDGILPDEVTLYDVADFGADYLTLYRRNGYVHYGWTTQQNGEKVYDFGAVYTGTADLEIYPVYVAIPTGLEAAYGQTLADVSLPDGWTWVDNTLSVGDIGNNYFQASYNSVRTDVKVTVSKGDPTYDVPADLTATIDDTLDSVVLPDGWTWNEPEKVLNKVGPEVCVATFTPEDTDHYNVVEIDLTVKVYHTEWTGEGTGTEADPYVITTKAELEYFRDIVNGFCVQTQNVYAHAILANDINLNGSESDQWIPIGEEFVSPNVFKGVFNGNDKKISGLYINNDKTWMGLFGTIDGGLVNNLTVEGTVTANWGAGIAGFIIGGGRIVDCVNKANVTGKYAAGIVMANNTTDNASGIVLNCVNEGTMTATQMAGGIAVSNDGIITDCVNKGQIQILNDATEDTTICVGGIAAHNTRTISDCINNGEVFVSLEYPTPNVSINVNAGGIAGRNFDSVTYCVNNADVEVQVNWGGRNEYAYVGGIVGSQRYQSDNERYRYEVRYCANDGDVSNYYGYTSNNVRHDYTGGIVGRFDYGVIADCYSTGHIHGGTCCGGICCTTDGSTEGTIINCYNAGFYEKGTLTAGNPIVANGNPTVISCYYRLSPQATSEDPNAYYDEDLAVQSNFEGWDFGKVWTMYTRYSTARPYLVREGIVYYDKNGEATNYGQARVILDVNDTLPAVNLFDIASFGDDYNALYGIPGYVLDGWATTAGGEKVYDFGDEYAAAEGIVLYPHYSLVTYTITYENWPAVDEGVTNDNPTSYTVEDGDIVLVAPNREGYEFIGWVIDDEDPVEDYTIISGTTGDITLTIEWLMMIDDPYGFAAPTVTALNGYVGAYDGKPHEISVTFEHELDVTYTYRWKKDGAIIEGATDATLTVKDVADTGMYTLLYTVSYNGRARAEEETAVIAVVIGKKNVTLNLPKVTSVEGNVANASATVSGAAQGDRIGIIIVYYNGTTELAEKPTRAGKYTAVASINEANYEADAVEAEFIVKVAAIAPENIEKPDGVNITVSSEDGFKEGTELVITNPDSPETIAEIQSKIGKDKEIVEIYHFEIKEDGEKAELEEPVTIRIPIPDELKDEKFELINVNGDDVENVKYKTDGDYVEFETATMGDFVFVRDKEKKDNTTSVKEESTGGLLDRDGRPSVKLLIYIILGILAFNFILTILLINKFRKL